jgi:DNA-binding SARP family transcriptional activator
LRVDSADVDLYQYRDLVAQARSAADDAEADSVFEAASRLWQGEPFASLSAPWLDEARMELGRERLAAELDHTDVRLRLGRPEQVLEAADARAVAAPLDERMAGQLMRALHACGRTAEAMAHYDTLRARLAQDLGIDPGGALQSLYRHLLTTAVDGPTEPRQAPPPAQLPLAAAGFAGRTEQLTQLDKLLAEAGIHRPVDTDTGVAGPAVVVAVSGSAGVGKPNPEN